MLDVVLLAMLSASQASPATQPAMKGQACTARELIGTWQLATKPLTPGVTSALKHITPTQFFVARLGDKGVIQSAHGGPYALAGGTYTETIALGFGGQFEKYRGISVSFQCRIDTDVLHLAGEYQGQTINEQWKREGGASAQR